MRRTLIWILPGFVALLAQFGCQTGGNEPFSCTETDDCPPGCLCLTEDRFFGTCGTPGMPPTAFCGGSCIDDTTCPEGTSCDLDDELILGGPTNLRLYACIPDSGTGGSGGAGGTGGTGGGAAAVTCLTVCPERDCREFSDNTFIDDNWEDVAVRQDDVTEYSVTQSTDGQGNPDPYRFVSHRLVPQPPRYEQVIIEVAHGNSEAVYDPSAIKAIHSLHYSYDGRALPGSRQASIRPLAKQDDRWFYAAFGSGERVLIDEDDGWVTREWGGEADQYQGVSLVGFGHTGELDLTENGTAITFGISTAASHSSNVETTRNTGVDNWRVVICLADSPP